MALASARSILPAFQFIAMAICTLQSSSVSSLFSSSPSVPRCDEAACARTSLKGFPPSVNSGCRIGSWKSLQRFTPRSSTQRDGESIELCVGGNENESTADCLSSAFRSLRATGRRECLLAMAVVGVLVSRENARAEETTVVDVAPKTELVDAPSLELYVDEKEGFKLLRPALWNKVEKAGATVLFEDPAKRGNTIGVVVNPVRISSLKDFGTPDVVAEKLIAAERKKPSTNEALLVRVQERQANGEIPLYCLEYTLDSSRGQKRILSAVTVASKKLYILNITYVDSAATPAPPAMADAFTQVLNSFDLLA